MLNNKLWMAGFVAGLVAVSGCSQQTEEAADAGQVEEAAEHAGDDALNCSNCR